jgi:5-amino-6-(5-phosphoribosylamino)uracil reductase
MPLPASLRLIYHARESYPREIALEAVYRNLEVRSPAARPAVIINMVQTFDGVVAVAGKAWSIGSEVDHYLFRTLRGWADVVLSGAGTLRQNDVIVATHPHLQAIREASGRPANPAAVVVSRRADFSDDVLRKRFFTQRGAAPIVVTTEQARAEDRRRVAAAGAEVLIVPPAPSGEMDMGAVLALLASRGAARVLCEGGPRTNRWLLEAGLVDEVFVTVAPHIVGDAGGRPIVAGLSGGAAADLIVISEHQHVASGLREWYFRFGVAGLPSGRSESP